MSVEKPVNEHRGLIEVLSRGVIDPEFRKTIAADPDKVAADYQLSANDALALKNIAPSEFEKASANVNMRPEWTIGIGGSFNFDTK